MVNKTKKRQSGGRATSNTHSKASNQPQSPVLPSRRNNADARPNSTPGTVVSGGILEVVNQYPLYDLAMLSEGKPQITPPKPPRLNLNIQGKKELSDLDNNETINIFKEINNNLKSMKKNKDKTVCIAFLEQNLESIVQTVNGTEEVLPIYEFIFINVGNIARIDKQNINIKIPQNIINFFKKLTKKNTETGVLEELCNIEETYKLINEIIKFKTYNPIAHRMGKIFHMNAETLLGKKRRTMKKNKNKKSVKKNKNKRKATIKKDLRKKRKSHKKK